MRHIHLEPNSSPSDNETSYLNFYVGTALFEREKKRKREIMDYVYVLAQKISYVKV